MIIKSIAPILILIAVSIMLFLLLIYNKLFKLVEAIKEDRRQMNVLLDWRFQLVTIFDEIANSDDEGVKTWVKQIETIYGNAHDARKQKKFQEYMRAENSISQLVKKLDFLFEQIQPLSENEEAVELKNGILNLQHDLEIAQKVYNEDLASYHVAKSNFFDSVILSVFAKNLKINFAYWKLK